MKRLGVLTFAFAFAFACALLASCHTAHDEAQPPVREGSAPAAPSSVPFAGLSPVAGDFTRKDFTFTGGEKLPSLRIHYVTLGTARRDASGHVTNAVLIMH